MSDSLVLEPREPASGLLDEIFRMHARGSGGEDGIPLTWRARIRDDEGRVWRATAERSAELPAAWAPAKATTGALASLQSLRPVQIDVRVESDDDGRAARRTVTRRLLSDGVRVRRWRDGLAATLHIPADPPCAALLFDATAGADQAATAALAAPLLASRGALALVVPPARGAGGSPDQLLATARELLASVPSTAGMEVVALAPLLPPGVPWRAADHAVADAEFAARADAWDALLARLGAMPRELPA